MKTFLELISKYAVLIYVICGVVILVYLRRAILARRERAHALFTLEREVATGKALRSVLVIGAFSLLAGAIFFINLSSISYFPSLTEEPPTPVHFITPLLQPTPTSEPVTPSPTPTPSPTSTPTLTPSPTPTKRPPSTTHTPTTVPRLCPNPDVRITFPGMNAHLKGVVEILGTADIKDFQYYKVEYGVGAEPDEWILIAETHPTAVKEGLLERWDTSGLSEGVYTLSLIVVDITGNYPEPCKVPVIVER